MTAQTRRCVMNASWMLWKLIADQWRLIFQRWTLRVAFGATSSPGCAALALRPTANDHVNLFEPEVLSTVYRKFYVDDCLKSVPSEREAVKLASDLQSLLKMGGFKLTQWLGNSRTVLNAIPESERAPAIVSLNSCDALPSDRTLGINWDVNGDEMKFKVKVNDQPYTRRGILSVVRYMTHWESCHQLYCEQSLSSKIWADRGWAGMTKSQWWTKMNGKPGWTAY